MSDVAQLLALRSFTELSVRQRARELLDAGTFRELIDPFARVQSPWLEGQGIVPQADDGVVDVAVEVHGLDNDRRAAHDALQHRRFMVGRFGTARVGGDVNPDDALLFADFVAAHLDLLDLHRLICGQRWHGPAGARRVKRPAMIAALHDAATVLAQHLPRR